MSGCKSLLAVGAALALAGCGGESIGGDVEVPDGYGTFKGDGVSFVHPAEMRRESQELPSGARLVRLSGPAAGDRPTAYVNFTVRPEDAEVFMDVVRTTRRVFEQSSKAKVSETEVDVEGADDARRLSIDTPAGSGRPRPETAEMLLVRDGKRVLILAAGRQEGRPTRLDEAAVVESFRLQDGA